MQEEVVEQTGAGTKDYGSYSFWLETCGDDLTPRDPLPGSLDCDVAIVGGGYTGLWTAYYLKAADPSMRIVIVEREICGFGASGRNGGWCSALFAAPKEVIAKAHGREAAIAMQQAMYDTVDEVADVALMENIACDLRKGGTLTFATTPAHLERVLDMIDEEESWGFGEPDNRWLDQREANERIRVNGTLGAAYTPHCSRLHPAKLARGLANVLEAQGVAIYEQTAAESIEHGRITTEAGVVTADVVVRATEGYTRDLQGLRRRLLPLYSLMVITEPMPASFWREVGWSNYETITDGRHLLIYAQRTADDRIAMGGRGAPYHFGSRIKDEYDNEPRVFDEIQRSLVDLFPAARGAEITHRWGGPLGVPRDWHSSVGIDRQAGVAWAGGYVGDGVSTSNLAGRTLADLILERETDITQLPWVGHRWRDWEPEPFRWLGVNLSLHTMSSADKAELRNGHPSRRARWIEGLTQTGATRTAAEAEGSEVDFEEGDLSADGYEGVGLASPPEGELIDEEEDWDVYDQIVAQQEARTIEPGTEAEAVDEPDAEADLTEAEEDEDETEAESVQTGNEFTEEPDATAELVGETEPAEDDAPEKDATLGAATSVSAEPPAEPDPAPAETPPALEAEAEPLAAPDQGPAETSSAPEAPKKPRRDRDPGARQAKLQKKKPPPPVDPRD